MEETRKTIIYVAVAVGLVLLAFVMAPKRITPDAFLDQGEQFFPDFTDPNDATTLEVIAFDEATGSAKPFKVTFEAGKWTIPSHHSYPADGKERLAKTAAGVIDIRKDDFRSDNVSDHEAFAVIDPLDETAGLTGRGKRVTIKGANDEILADLIIGNQVEGREGLRFVRVPGQNRVYASRMDIDISTRFEDWIETDLLEVQKYRIKKVVLKDYSINERTRTVEKRDDLILTKKGDEWTANKMSGSQQVDSLKMDTLLTVLDNLTIVGVRPKPAGLSASLSQTSETQSISQADVMSLQRKGYFFTPDGQLLSNEGELLTHTKDGVKYSLRFGEVVHGTGEAVTAGSESDEQEDGAPVENRYLFITAEFDIGMLSEPEEPKDKTFQKKADSLWTDKDRSNKSKQDAHDRWTRDVKKGQELAEALNDRFAAWYYVISDDSFDKLRLTRKDLVVRK